MVDMGLNSVLARKLSTFLPMSQDELNCLAQMQSAPVVVKRGQQLVREGQTGHKAFVLQAGWASSYKDLPNGTRQIISFAIAADCVGLRSALLRTADHSFAALTDSVVISPHHEGSYSTSRVGPCGRIHGSSFCGGRTGGASDEGRLRQGQGHVGRRDEQVHREEVARSQR
jgi:cyclic nucleotide-binding protein